jgi:hypothetical protein
MSANCAGCPRPRQKLPREPLELIFLERGEADDWFASKLITTCVITSLISLPTFVWWELRVKNPIINVRLLKEQIVINGTMLMGLQLLVW